MTRDQSPNLRWTIATHTIYTLKVGALLSRHDLPIDVCMTRLISVLPISIFGPFLLGRFQATDQLWCQLHVLTT